ncbi:sialidase family protein [Pseudochryseolinea flava]|uniref:Exo-alpha-sialidase n=1 Tax=Pseudochryseolinea flava TaxID=2059302 RepID=A0A364Y0Q1_9BACT|nr:sialidase family protein [Pseudochryseolinea flava]RAW00161.1 hypothetical protein DQQ10_16565 [Pseudochryseolinea flava]
MKLKTTGALTAITLVSSMAFGQTVKDLGEVSATAHNVAVTVNPKNPQNIIAATGGAIHYSIDGGQNWTKSLSEALGVGAPVVVANVKGDAHYLHTEQTASGSSVIFCHASSDGGKTWSEPIAVTDPQQKDRRMPWAIYDGKENLYVSWTEFDKYGSDDANCQSRIMLSRSSSGKKWGDPIEISQTPGNCVDDKSAVAGSMPAAGIDGKMFVGWSQGDRVMVDRSFDGGLWLSNDIPAIQQRSGRKIEIPDLGPTNGKALIVSDRGKSEQRGLLYVVFADQRYGKTTTDIYFTRSVNFGDLWISPEKVTPKLEGVHHQFLPWATIDQSTGFLYIVYYEMDEDGLIHVKLSWSNDAGISFKTLSLTSAPIHLPSGYTPEYINVSAHKGVVSTIWLQDENGKSVAKVATVKYEDLAKNQ